MKNLKRGLSILIALSLLLGFGTDVPKASAAKKVKAKSVSLNYKKKTLTAGSSLKLKATVKPKKAKATITWNTSNKKVATVSSKGKVKAKKKGSAKITATVKGTKLKAVSKITVKAKSTDTASVQTPAPTNGGTALVSTSSVPSVVPSPVVTQSVNDTLVIASQSDVSSVLAAAADPNVTTVKIITDKAEEIELPEGNYSSLELVIEAPKAEISNHAVFKKITINQIAADTYHEYAKGNKIYADCPVGRIIITDSAFAEINVQKKEAELSIEVNSSASGSAININGEHSVVDISGTTPSKIDVNAKVECEIQTSHLLSVTAIAKVTFVVYPGAEDSEFYITSEEFKPAVYGVGSITYFIEGEVYTIIAEYRDDVSGEQGIVSLEGSIVDYDSDEAIEGAVVYVVPFTNNFDEDAIESNAYAKTMVTDENGKYTIDSIRTGNYIMVVKEEGMVPAIQYLVITSRYGNVFQNETLKLFPRTADNETGVITGILSNSLDGQPIEGLTARLRKGKGNTVGNVLKKTTSTPDGSYTFDNVEPGYYTVEFVDLRTSQEDGNYITTSMNAVVRPGATDTVSAALTKSVSASQMRFVLTWGDETSGAPADLDSHLTGPKKDNNSRFHTYFLDTEYYENGVQYADLDYDDTYYEGPETTTIYESVPGIYEFYIHNYSDKYETKSSALAASGAKVEVYQGTTLLVTYYVPNNEGTVWHVCSYDSTTGTLTQNREMYYESDVNMIGTDPKERALTSLKDYLSSLDSLIQSLKDNAAKTALQAKYNEYKTYADGDFSGYSLEDIQSNANAISDLINKINSDVSITDMTIAGDSDAYAEVSNASSSVVIYTLDSSGISEEDIDVEVSEKSTYQLISKDGILSAIEVTSDEGYVKNFTVSYDVPSIYFYLDDVEGENVTGWSSSYDYSEEQDVLNIYTTDGKNSEFTITLVYSDKAEVSYNKDNNGNITSVTLTVGNSRKDYKVEYSFDTSLLYPADINSDSANFSTRYWDYDWDDDYEIYYYIEIGTKDGKECDFTVTPRSTAIQVDFVKDAGKVVEVILSCGDYSRSFQVIYQFDTSMLNIANVASDDDNFDDWYCDWDYDDNDEKLYYIIIQTDDGESCDFTVTSQSEDAQITYQRNSGVIQSVTVVVGENVRTYEICYSEW